jgi:hypothetical protein
LASLEITENYFFTVLGPGKVKIKATADSDSTEIPVPHKW